ncbi:MAG: hypothetical protein D6702_06445 [Planctomycetota bacterium]|nr:MAG: hypothetical protein D6702_06445 [Planctomycetota bacterium]
MSMILASLFLGVVFQGDPAQELAAVVARARKVESYAFQVETTSSGGFRGRGAPATLSVLGAWQQGRPVRLESGGTVAFRDGERTVFQDAEGDWKAFDRGAMRGRFGGRGGAAAGRLGGRREGAGGEPPEGGRPPEGAEPPPGAGPPPAGGAREPDPERRAMMDRMMLLRAPLPHALLADLGAGVGEVERSEGEGGAVHYHGTLTPEGAAKLGGLRRPGGRGPEFEHSGSFELTVGADGRIQGFAYEVVSKGSFRGREIELKRSTRVVISGIGSTTVEVPAAAAAALASSGAGSDEEF